MNAELVVGIAVLVLAGVLFGQRVRELRYLRLPVGAMGSGDRPLQGRQLTAEEAVVLSQYLRQQQWAFALAWLSASMALVLGLGAIIRWAALGFSMGTVVGSIAAIGGLAIARGCWKLYTTTSDRVERIIGVPSGKEGQTPRPA